MTQSQRNLPMSHLFDPYQIGNLALANRIAIAPMC